MRRRHSCDWFVVYTTILTLFLFPSTGFSADPPQKDGTLPSIQFTTPILEEDLKYLGVKGETFELKDVACQILLLEVIGVYCPRCYEQAPLFNKLFTRLNKGKLSEKVKMLGVAAGGTSTEIKYLREKGQYNYPIVQDESFVVHKLLGEPRTPFTLLVDKDGKVLDAHLGVIKDVDTFYESIKELAK